MFKKVCFFVLLTFFVIQFSAFTLASEISLSDVEILLNGENLPGENAAGVILSNKMNNGSTEEKALEENVSIGNIITITKPGEYVFSGTLSDGQIAVDANQIDGEVKIILDGLKIMSKNAPAIFVYSKDINNDKCQVTISTTKDSVNEISGGRLKASVEEIENQDAILYYVEKGTDDKGVYYERYKYDGAISSDISITFSGEGVLNINGIGKEGIEGKMNINIEKGTYIIKSVDDAINACSDGQSVITINGGEVIAYVENSADEGDGIDSNGYIYINAGKVYAFARTGSDSGLDSDKGTYVNGGEVLATGSMNDNVIISENLNSARATFNGNIKSGDDILVADEDGNVVFAIKANRDIGNFLYTSDVLQKGKTYNSYTNGVIAGENDEWGVYTNIVSYDLESATKNEFNEMMGRPNFDKFYEERENKNTLIATILLVLSGVLFIIILTWDMKSENTNVNMKLKIGNLVVGLVIGILLSVGISLLIDNNSYDNNFERNFDRNQMNPREFENGGQVIGRNQIPGEIR